MTDQELSDFIITCPYLLTEEDKSAIQKASPGAPIKEHWEQSCLKKFKNRLREYYFDAQNDKCVYCRMDISSATGISHIEHIAPKSIYPQWMYEPMNLCLSCPTCNSFKGTNDILEHHKGRKLPTVSDAYKIVHPHLDRYSDHIRIIDSLLYQGLTPKGKYTIDICHLTRTSLLEERAKQKILREQSPNSYSEILLTYINNDNLIENLDTLIPKVQKIVAKFCH